MKVLFVNTSDHTGGAAIAALRLLRALRRQGIDATLLCRDSTLTGKEEHIIQLRPTLWRKAKFILERLEIFVRNGFTRKGLFSIDTARCGNDITKLPAFKEADVIHLHWTNQAMLSLSDLRRILHSGKRIVWTMHDMWAFTGICHYADLCNRWQTRCGSCPLLKHPRRNDLATQIFEKKRKTYAEGNVAFVGCSQWIADFARKSPLLVGKEIVSIPNALDTAFYAPAGLENMFSQATIREKLGLPLDKKLMLFTAYRVTDEKKGFLLLRSAIEQLVDAHPDYRETLGIVLAGHEAETLHHAFPIDAFPMGYITDEAQMRSLYQAADLLLMPTLMDNLPNTIAEAQACALPCVAFGVGGVTQMVETGVNGYLAQPRDASDFARGIHLVLSSPSYPAMCRNARTKALKAYSEKNVAARYLEVYQGKGNV